MSWEEKLTSFEFTPVNIKKCGRHNFRKHKDIKNGEKYITLDISLKCGSLDNMKITSSEPTYYYGRSGKGLITSMGLKTIGRSKKNKNTRYTITNISMKDLSKIIREFENLPYDLFQPKIPPILSFSGMYLKQFFYPSNRTNSR